MTNWIEYYTNQSQKDNHISTYHTLNRRLIHDDTVDSQGNPTTGCNGRLTFTDDPENIGTSSPSVPISEVIDLQTTLDSKCSTSHNHTKSDIGLGNVDNTSDANKPISSATQTALNGKANTSHTHIISDVVSLQSSLDGKAASIHTHPQSEITNLVSDLAAKEPALPSKTGNALKYLRVNSGANGFEYATPSGGGGPIVLGADVTHNVTTTYATVFTIPLTANQGNFASIRLIAETNTSGGAVQVRCRVSQSTTIGYFMVMTPTTATASPIDNLALGTNPSDTGETVWLAAVNVPIPIIIEVGCKTGATPGDLIVEIQPEVASTITVKAGSNYTKTP